MGRASKDLLYVKIGISPEHRDRIQQHMKRTGWDMSHFIRAAIQDRLEFLDAKDTESKKSKGRGIAHVPEHEKPRGLGPAPKSSSTASPPPRSPFELLKSPPTEIPEKVKKAFKHWAEYIEEADGLVDIEQRTKMIVKDLRERVDESAVQPCYEAFVEFLSARKESKEKATFSLDVPIVGDV